MSTRTFRQSWPALCVAIALLGAACGPSELPAFANPPPYDAGSLEDDAGPPKSPDAGR